MTRIVPESLGLINDFTKAMQRVTGMHSCPAFWKVLKGDVFVFLGMRGPGMQCDVIDVYVRCVNDNVFGSSSELSFLLFRQPLPPPSFAPSGTM